MGFGDLKSDKGQSALNDYLADKSYIEGYVASQADVVVFKAVGNTPPAKLAHLLRWYNHIESYGNAKDGFPGIAKQLAEYGPADATGGDDDDDDDDGVDLFGDDDEVNSEDERIKNERLAAYDAKKSKKPAVIAKSIIMLDVKPWDDETDMKALEAHVRGIEMDGLNWGAGKLVAVGYGIQKLQITCVVEDAKVGTDDLDEKITANEDLVQSVDIAAFNKV